MLKHQRLEEEMDNLTKRLDKKPVSYNRMIPKQITACWRYVLGGVTAGGSLDGLLFILERLSLVIWISNGSVHEG